MKAVRQELTTPCYEFGPFTVDTAKCVLLRNGEVVPLSLKAFEILLALIQHRGQGLEKNELLKRVWPDTVVEENNLARHISALRKALDEQPNEHRYILTIPGHGYRFVANVREVEDESATFNGAALNKLNGSTIEPEPAINEAPLTAAVTVPVDKSIRQITRRWRGMAAALTILVVGSAVIGLVVSLVRPGSYASQPPPQRKLWQLTFDSGLESEPTWSPDGRLIAYSADRNGSFDIWVRPLGEGNAVRVTNSPTHDWQPDWAPEGNRLVFRSERDGGGLFVVPILGGNERRVSTFGYRPRWSPDGTQILFSSSLRPVTEIPKFYVVGLDGKAPREVLTSFLPEFALLQVAWHPDGRRLSVWGKHRQQDWSFWTVPLDGGTPVKSAVTPHVEQRFKEADVMFTGFRWSPTGKALYFEGIAGSVKNLWKVEVEPQSLRWTAGPERLTTGTGQDTDLTVSPDGKRLAFTARAESTRLWSIPFNAATGRVKQTGQPVTAAGIDAYFPDLSPDGQRLIFLAQRVGKEELWEKSLKDGRETLRLANEELASARPRWAPDGRRLAYDRSRPPHPGYTRKESAIFLLSEGRSESQPLTTPGTTSDVVWDWSADGQWILGGSYGQNPARRFIGLFPTAAAPQAEKQMRVLASHPEQNLYQARYSPDSRWISFIAAKAFEAGISTIYVLPAAGGDWKRITEGKYFDDKPRWSPDGRKLYFISNRTGFFNVWGIGFDPVTGQPVGEAFRVTDFESPSQMILPDVITMEMALAADRLILPIMEVSGGIWVLENVER
jgi:Tol biopolymer transport system component/DNA-binding winged helix-turn-helix (wHTH) protein